MTADSTADSRIGRYSGSVEHGVPVGAGVRGKRDDQDEAVEELARRLAEQFPDHEVEIRFNRDRLGGGAWLKNESRSAQVGVGAKLAAPRWYERKRREYVYGDGEKPRPLASVDPEQLDLTYTVKLEVPAVLPCRANRRVDRDDKRANAHRTFDEIERAWRWFEASVIREGVCPPCE